MSTFLLATPAEVWEMAFPPNANGPDDQINDTLIETAQLRYLKPALGPLYDTLGESRHAEFVTQFLKKPLAYYVRSLSLNTLSASVGSLGILEGKTDYARSRFDPAAAYPPERSSPSSRPAIGSGH